MPKPNPSKPPSSDSAGLLSEMGAKIVHYIQAGYPGLYVVSAEEQRVEAEFKAVVTQLNAAARRNGKPPYTLCYWTVVNGLVNTDTKQVQNCNDPLEVLDIVAGLKENAVVLLKDFHLFLTDPNPILLRKLKDTLLLAKASQKPLILLGCRLCLPPELEHELTVVEFTLPGKPQLHAVLDGVMESAGIKALDVEVREKAVEAASGLTTMEAENAFSLSYVQTRTIEPQIVALEKAQAVKRNGLLEIVEVKETLNSIGGLDLLKDWLLRRKDAFSQRAISYGTEMDVAASLSSFVPLSKLMVEQITTQPDNN